MTQRWNPDEYKASFLDVLGLFNYYFPHLSKWVEIKGDTFLELGSGSGKWSAAFTCLGMQCVLVDNTKGMFDRVRANFPIISKTFFFVDDDALELKNVPINTFDIVFSEGLYEHFLEKGDRIKFVLNTFNVLKENGIAIIMVPYKTGLDDEVQFEIEELVSEWMQVFPAAKGFKFTDIKENKDKIIGVIAKKVVINEDG